MYNVKPYHLKKAMELGVEIQPSTKGFYKLDVYRDGKYLTSIGDKRYMDYQMYMEIDPILAEKRRQLYWGRHTKEGVREYLAKHILW
jgi:hypothetical protein